MLLLTAACAWAGPAPSAPLKVELVSETNSVRPGRPLKVGLRFRMEEGWHIYWRNPGDSGASPEIRWKLPAGFQAGDVQWPAPERLGSGSVIDYGYRDSVLLPVEIRAPGASLAAGGTFTLSAEVSWLVCRDVCEPGQAEVTLTLPVREASSPGPAHALFRATRARLPRPMPSSWRAEAFEGTESFVLSIHGPGTAKAAFFPLEPGQIDNAAPQAAAKVPGGVRLTLRKSDQLSRTPARLDGVLELTPGQFYAVSAPVRLSHEAAAP
jgi:thiol:disulfide interchange protein DsbD